MSSDSVHGLLRHKRNLHLYFITLQIKMYTHRSCRPSADGEETEWWEESKSEGGFPKCSPSQLGSTGPLLFFFPPSSETSARCERMIHPSIFSLSSFFPHPPPPLRRPLEIGLFILLYFCPDVSQRGADVWRWFCSSSLFTFSHPWSDAELSQRTVLTPESVMKV